MKPNCLWTSLGARLQRINSFTEQEQGFNWLFLPGGPGLGSESLAGLTSYLKLPGTLWHLDLPGDGSNTTSNNALSFSYWAKALQEAVSCFDKTILVAHSTGGMYALAIPELAHILHGIVLMDSAPDATWQQHFTEYVKQNPIKALQTLEKQYLIAPDNELLKQMVLASTAYCFVKNDGSSDLSFLHSLPYNHESCDWSGKHFDSTYQSQWHPENMPALIMAGAQDHITPLSLFEHAPSFSSQHKNILVRAIPDAGHFPWIDNPASVQDAFNDYCQILEK